MARKKKTDVTPHVDTKDGDENPESYFLHIGDGVYRAHGRDNGQRYTKDDKGHFVLCNSKAMNKDLARYRDNGKYVRRKNKPLSPKHHKAVEYYLQGYTKTEALKKAGYAVTTAEHMQWKIFGREDVQREIERRQWRYKGLTNSIQDRIIEELANIAFFNIGHLIEITEDGQLVFDYNQADLSDFAAIGEITVETYVEGRGDDAETVKRVKVKPYDKKAALDSLARIHSMFQDNLNVTKEENLEERLQAGRKRIGKRRRREPEAIDVDYEEVE